MKVYLEAREQGDMGTEREFIRLDVSSKSEPERVAILTKLKEFMAGKTCTFTKHNCHHDTGGACTSEEV